MRTAEVVEAFVTARGGSVRYEESLRYHLARLDRFDELPERPEPIEAVMLELQRRGLSAETRRGTWRVLSMLYGWAARRYGVVNVMMEVKRPDRRRQRRETLSQDEVEWLLRTSRRYRRDYALLLFLLDTGARIGEAFSVQRSDIKRDGDVFLVELRGKTGERLVPLSGDTVNVLLEVAQGEDLWGVVHTNGLQKAVSRALKRANLGGRGGAHMLRHTFGTLYIKRGGDAFRLQRIMGHADIETTLVYVHMQTGDLTSEHAELSPVAGIERAGRQLTFLREETG